MLTVQGWMFDQKKSFNSTTMVKYYKTNPSHLFNLFASHSFWNTNEVKKIIGINATFITILRDPLEVFESGYVYFGFEKFFRKNINKFVSEVLPYKMNQRPKNHVFGKNQQLYNLGLNSIMMTDRRKILQ